MKNVGALVAVLGVLLLLVSCGSDNANGGCPGGQTAIYTTAGCGTSATPVCISGGVDGCANDTYCSCTGTTIRGCGLSPVPFASMGPCADAGGGN
jgi:hypothetical protein